MTEPAGAVCDTAGIGAPDLSHQPTSIPMPKQAASAGMKTPPRCWVLRFI
jgi:hypothetical protein